jgi:short-subunit dehydrogenase
VAELTQKLAGIKGDISILVNNVGVSKFQEFEKLSTYDIFNHLIINCNSQSFVSHALIPRLLAREGKKRSAIINLSSRSAFVPKSMSCLYGATKAFNLVLGINFTESYSDRIDVLTVTPGSTKTQMNSGVYVFSITAE